MRSFQPPPRIFPALPLAPFSSFVPAPSVAMPSAQKGPEVLSFTTPTSTSFPPPTHFRFPPAGASGPQHGGQARRHHGSQPQPQEPGRCSSRGRSWGVRSGRVHHRGGRGRARRRDGRIHAVCAAVDGCCCDTRHQGEVRRRRSDQYGDGQPPMVVELSRGVGWAVRTSRGRTGSGLEKPNRDSETVSEPSRANALTQ